GQFYRVENAVLKPEMDSALLPGFFMSGSSEAGIEAATATGAVAIQYPGPPDQAPRGVGRCGVRVGIVARPVEEEAWNVALSRFPEDRKGQITRQLATKVSDSSWHHSLAEIGGATRDRKQTYWLGPFENYQTNCPYL